MIEIKIGGKVRPIHFGMRTINDFAKRTGREFGDAVTTADAVGTLDSIVAVTALALNEGARLSGREERYTEDQVWDFVDAEPGIVLDVADLFKESIDDLTGKLGDISPK